MKARAKAPGERRGKAPRKQLATKAAKRHAPAASAAAKPKESDDATLEQQRTQLQYFVPDGGNGDGGFWVLADVTGSIKKADLVGTWLTVAFLPSMGLPKLPIRATTPPKDVVNALGAEVLASLAAAAPKPEEASSSQAAGEYWEVQDGAKRVKKAPKAAMHSGHTML